MDHVGVGEASDDVEDGLRFADVGEKFIAEAFAATGTLDQACDVDEFNGGVDDLLGMDDSRELVQPVVGDRNGGLIRLDGAEGIVLRRGVLRPCQCVEKCGLAHVGKSDDADAKPHEYSFDSKTGLMIPYFGTFWKNFEHRGDVWEEIVD